jgi:hypothetical protein
MTFGELRLHVDPGDGVVAKLGDVVVMAVPAGVEHEAVLGGLLSIIEGDFVGRGPAAVRPMARRIAALLSSCEPESVPPFCVLAEAEGGVAVFLHGALDVEATGPRGTERLSGRDATTWVDRILKAGFDRLAVVPAGNATVTPDPRSDLRAGVVRGGGLTLRPRQAAADMPPAKVPAAAAEAPPVEAPPAPAPPPPSEPLAAEPLPTGVRATRVSSDAGAQHGEPEPGAEPGPAPERSGPTRTLAGFLIFDDGSAVVLDDDYVLGREPEGDPEVQQGRAKALVVDDPSLMVSRVHARISVRDGEVTVVDANSANGTLVAGPDDDGWSPLEPDSPLAIVPGTRILLGERSLVFERRPPSEDGQP